KSEADIVDQPTTILAVPEGSKGNPPLKIERESTPAPRKWAVPPGGDVEDQPTRPMIASTIPGPQQAPVGMSGPQAPAGPQQQAPGPFGPDGENDPLAGRVRQAYAGPQGGAGRAPAQAGPQGPQSQPGQFPPLPGPGLLPGEAPGSRPPMPSERPPAFDASRS